MLALPGHASVADGPLFATSRWLTAMRGRIPGEPYTFRLGEAMLHGTVVRGAHPGEVFDLPYVLTGDPPQLPLSAATRAVRGEPVPWAPYLIVMLPGYECHPLGPAAHDEETLTALVEEIVAWSRGHDLRAVAFLYTPPGELPGVLGRRGFTRIPLSYGFELRLPLAALSRKRRGEARRELRVLADAGVRLRMAEIDAPTPEMIALKCGHAAKYGKADPATTAARLGDLCRGGALLFAAELDESLVGYALFIAQRGTWYCVSTARRYDCAGARHTYFATVFYEPARHAGEAGVDRLHYGQGSWGAKLSRGCHAVELPGWVLALDPELKPAVEYSALTTALALD